MQTKKIIIVFIIWGLVMLSFKWFFSEMYQIFTPFLLIIPLGILFILANVLGVLALVSFIRGIKAKCFLLTLPLIMFVCIVSVYLFASFTLPKVRIEHTLYSEKREIIVEAIQNNEYTDDGIGNIELPSNRRFLSCDGEVYVYQNDEDGIVAGFWSFRGLLMNRCQLVIYTSYAEPPTSSTLRGRTIYEIEKLSENWYWVEVY